MQRKSLSLLTVPQARSQTVHFDPVGRFPSIHSWGIENCKNKNKPWQWNVWYLINSHLVRGQHQLQRHCSLWSTYKECVQWTHICGDSWTCTLHRRDHARPHRAAALDTHCSRWVGDGSKQTSCADPPSAEWPPKHPTLVKRESFLCTVHT